MEQTNIDPVSSCSQQNFFNFSLRGGKVCSQYRAQQKLVGLSGSQVSTRWCVHPVLGRKSYPSIWWFAG